MSVFNYTRPGFRLFAGVMTLAAALLLNACGKDGGGFDTGVTIPQNVVAYAGSGIVTLTWDAVDDADSYTVYWDTQPGVTTSDNTIAATTTHINHTALSNTGTYYYRVSSTVSGHESRLSDELAVNPTDWTAPATNQAPPDDLNGLASGGTPFVAVGNNDTRVASTDADRDVWSDTTPLSGTFALNGVTWAAGPAEFVAVGMNSGTVMHSENGTSWNNLGTTGGDLADVAWDGSQYVAVGPSRRVVLIHIDPSFASVPATTVPGTTEDVHAIEWGGSDFVAVGSDGFIISSTDGDAWTLQAAGKTSEHLRGIAWDGGQFVVVGDNATVLTSPNGIDWTLQAVPAAVTDHLHDVHWNGALFIAVGDNGTILRSVDGKSWVVEISDEIDHHLLYAVSSDDNYDVLAGASGVIYKRPR